MDDITSFGAWLKRRRQVLGLTQDVLAQRVGCAVATIRKIEGGARRPSIQIAERLADVLALAPQERGGFLRAARAELAADRLPQPAQLPSDLPSGTVTFLFTDIEGSTRRWEQHQAAMPRALARHDAILRQAIAAHGGVVFKTVGDAVCAAFARRMPWRPRWPPSGDCRRKRGGRRGCRKGNRHRLSIFRFCQAAILHPPCGWNIHGSGPIAHHSTPAHDNNRTFGRSVACKMAESSPEKVANRP
jgi:transcriptional regulator with XRE-family HTH domain